MIDRTGPGRLWSSWAASGRVTPVRSSGFCAATRQEIAEDGH